MHHGGETRAAQVARAGEVVVPGRQMSVHAGQESAAARRFWVRLVDEPGGQRVNWGLHDPGGLDTCRSSRFRAVPRGAPEIGAREIGVEGDRGIEDDVRNPSVGPLGPDQRLQLALSTPYGQMAQADGDEGRVPAPLMGIQAAGRDGGTARPVGEQDPCRAASKSQVVDGGGHGVWSSSVTRRTSEGTWGSNGRPRQGRRSAGTRRRGNPRSRWCAGRRARPASPGARPPAGTGWSR